MANGLLDFLIIGSIFFDFPAAKIMDIGIAGIMTGFCAVRL